MGLFGKRVEECDWCGAPIDGQVLEDGGLRLCSHACLELKNAPAASPAARTVPDIRVATHGLAASELAIAVAELELYERLGTEADELADDSEEDFMRAQEAYLGLWGHLETVRAYLVGRGASVAEFDEHHRYYLATSDAFRIVEGGNFHGRRESFGVAMFRPENLEHARAAIAVLQHAMAQHAER